MRRASARACPRDGRRLPRQQLVEFLKHDDAIWALDPLAIQPDFAFRGRQESRDRLQ
jgi:hypothetical protein